MSGYQAIAVVSVGLALLAGLWDGSRMWRKRRLSVLALAVGAAGPIVALVLYLAATGLALKPAATVGLVGVGFVLGVIVAGVPRLERTLRGPVRLSRAAWLPLPAALCVAALQACAAAGTLAGVILSLAALEAGAGFGVGAALRLTLRRLTLGHGRAVGARPSTGPDASPGPHEREPAVGQ